MIFKKTKVTLPIIETLEVPEEKFDLCSAIESLNVEIQKVGDYFKEKRIEQAKRDPIKEAQIIIEQREAEHAEYMASLPDDIRKMLE